MTEITKDTNYTFKEVANKMLYGTCPIHLYNF